MYIEDDCQCVDPDYGVFGDDGMCASCRQIEIDNIVAQYNRKRNIENMANKNESTTHVIRGTLHWAKVLGEPRLNTYSKEKEWSVDLTPNEAGLAEIKRIGIDKKLKTPKDNDTREEDFIGFRQKESREDRRTGERIANEPIKVVDVTGAPWPQDKLIGNGTIADVKFRVVDYGKAYDKGVYISAIRVLDHVAYEVEEFAPLGPDDDFGSSAKAASPSTGKAAESRNNDDFEDEVPF